MADYVNEVTEKKSFEYGKYRSFEHVLFYVCQDMASKEKILDKSRQTVKGTEWVRKRRTGRESETDRYRDKDKDRDRQIETNQTVKKTETERE